jgi:hypothetical protein
VEFSETFSINHRHVWLSEKIVFITFCFAFGFCTVNIVYPCSFHWIVIG